MMHRACPKQEFWNEHRQAYHNVLSVLPQNDCKDHFFTCGANVTDPDEGLCVYCGAPYLAARKEAKKLCATHDQISHQHHWIVVCLAGNYKVFRCTAPLHGNTPCNMHMNVEKWKCTGHFVKMKEIEEEEEKSGFGCILA